MNAQPQISYPVQVDWSAGEAVSTGLSYEDYVTCHTIQHKQSGERRLPTPAWALNDNQLRPLLVRYLENRAGFRYAQPGTDPERMGRAQQVLQIKNGQLHGVLKKLCAELVSLKRQPARTEADVLRLQKLPALIEGLDTTIVVNRNVAAKVTGVVYYYYRVGLDSVGVAERLGLKPPAVRQVLLRLRRCWEDVQNPKTPKGPQPKVSCVPQEVTPEKVVALCAADMSYSQIAQHLACSRATVRNVLRRAGAAAPFGPLPLDGRVAHQLLAAKLPWSAVLKVFGTKHTNRVRRAILRAGLTPPALRKGRKLAVDPEKVLQLRGHGLKFWEIGKKLGCSTACAWLTAQRATGASEGSPATQTPPESTQEAAQA